MTTLEGSDVKTRLELAVLVEEMCSDSSDSVRSSALKLAKSLRLDQDPDKEDVCLVLLFLLNRERSTRSLSAKKKASSPKSSPVDSSHPRSAFAERIREKTQEDSESEDEAAKELRRKLGLPSSDQRGRRGF